MIQVLRSSKIIFSILISVIFSLVNLSIDPPNLSLKSNEINDNSYDESESLSELIIENMLDCFEMFPELPDNIPEDESSCKELNFVASIVNDNIFNNQITFCIKNLPQRSYLLINQYYKSPTAPPPVA